MVYKYTISANIKTLTRWLNRCIPMKDNVLSTIRINHIYTKDSTNNTIYEWYLTDNLNYQAIPIKCRNIGKRYNI